MAQTSFSFLLGSLVLLVVILLMGRPVLEGTVDNIMIILYVGVMVTGLGYFCYFKSIALSDAATGSFAFFLKPAIAPVLARIILKETILWNTVVGIGLILAASLLRIIMQKQAGAVRKAEERRRQGQNAAAQKYAAETAAPAVAEAAEEVAEGEEPNE